MALKVQRVASARHQNVTSARDGRTGQEGVNANRLTKSNHNNNRLRVLLELANLANRPMEARIRTFDPSLV